MAPQEKVQSGEDAAPLRSSPMRRAFVSAILAGLILPRLALAQQQDKRRNQEAATLRMRMTFDGQSMTATLEDNPSARDFASLLPLELSIDDYAHNEKIAIRRAS